MKEIILTKGKVALVDDEDYDAASDHYWWAIPGPHTWYAQGIINKKRTSLHRFIMKPTAELQVDHIDCNGLNCQKYNMRICTNEQNRRNQRKQSNTSSQYKGVYWNKRDELWISHITYHGKPQHIGCHHKEDDAAKAYDRMAIILFGEFARTNFKVH